jgi:hypothetical protein
MSIRDQNDKKNITERSRKEISDQNDPEKEKSVEW